LILCKRVEQTKFIYEKLKETGEIISLLIANSNDYDKNSRIIVATTNKVGMGFSYPKLDTLIFATDIISNDTEEYLVQYIGRIMRREDVKPMIFDIVDDQSILQKHFKIRKTIYLKVGGKIQNIKNIWEEYNQDTNTLKNYIFKELE
jgi:superfamily II DNA or RNA helicase